jgi:hypothetical protein
VKRLNTWWGIGQWQCVYPISLSGHAGWPRSQELSNLKYMKTWIDLHRCSPAVNFRQQRNKVLDTKYSIDNSWRKFKRNECLINVCKSSDKRFVNCPHLRKLQLRFSRHRQCLFLKLLRQWTHMMGRLLRTLKHEQPMFIWYTNSRHCPQF